MSRARVNVRGAIGIRVRTAEDADLRKVDVEALNDLANRALEMLRLMPCPLPEAELSELIRYTIRFAPEHYFSDPDPIRWFESTLHNARYWHALNDAGDTRRLRLVDVAVSS